MADLQDGRIKQYFFRPGSITAASNGRFETFSDKTEIINGELKSIVFLANNYADAGSFFIFESGLGNSGTGVNGLFMRIVAENKNRTYYPFDYGSTDIINSGSRYIHIQKIINSSIRVVGSGVGGGRSGLGIIINYI